MFIRFDGMHESDGRRDKRTLHDGIGCVYANIAWLWGVSLLVDCYLLIIINNYGD